MILQMGARQRVHTLRTLAHCAPPAFGKKLTKVITGRYDMIKAWSRCRTTTTRPAVTFGGQQNLIPALCHLWIIRERKKTIAIDQGES